MKLFERGLIGNMRVKNRIVMAPMNIPGMVETDGRLSQRGIDYYVARAKGGTGLIITAGIGVTRKFEGPTDGPWVRDIFADNDACVARFNELALALHDYGAKVVVQLTAGRGRALPGSLLKERKAVAPSALPCVHDPSVTARELTTDEIEGMVKAFEYAAARLKLAEIDGIELHAHAGYLFDQFLTPIWNKRTDKYGGDLNGRLRFSLEVIEAVKRGAGSDFPIIYRFSLKHYCEGGREPDEGVEIARKLEEMGVDALDIDAGSFEARYWTAPTSYHPPGCLVPLGEMAKKAVKIPVIIVGKLGYPELAEQTLQDEKADFIALGRPLLADPEWPNKVREGRQEDICPCLGDNEGCVGRLVTTKYLSCTVNPMVGMEREFTIVPAAKKKSVLVVGGGPGGMEAARVAALRGHNVVLWEKSEALGGNLIPASVASFKKDYRQLIKYLSTQIEKLGVTVELNKEATPELIQEMNPEVICIATGSRHTIPDIPGVKGESVATVIDLFLGRKNVGRSLLILGAGVVGCEAALHFANQGKKVTVVARSENIAKDIVKDNRDHLMTLLADVKILVNTNVIEIRDKEVIAIDRYGRRFALEADTVGLAVGFTPERTLLERIGNSVKETYSIGDCNEPRLVINAIWEGFRSARLI
jgi:2-enoate reductase